MLAREIDELHQALASHAVIDQAKRILMSRFGIEGPRAFLILRRWSMDSNIRIRKLSEALIELTEGSAGATDPNARAVVANGLRGYSV